MIGPQENRVWPICDEPKKRMGLIPKKLYAEQAQGLGFSQVMIELGLISPQLLSFIVCVYFI